MTAEATPTPDDEAASGLDAVAAADVVADGNVQADSGLETEAESDDESDLSVPAEVRAALEAILMVAEEPVASGLLAQLLEVSQMKVEATCAALAASYEAEERGFTIARVAGGFRFQSHGDQAPYVERFLLEGQTSRFSGAALETLAIVAYKQPISRAQVSAIRGVNVDGVIRSLHQRGYVAEVGRDQGPGNASLYGTTRLFLERMGIDSLSDLPPLVDFVPDADIVETLELALRVGDDPDLVDAPAGGPSVAPEPEPVRLDAADEPTTPDDNSSADQ
jgi:segregation and condensation protein B